MLLTLDAGNSRLSCGIFLEDKMIFSFGCETKEICEKQFCDFLSTKLNESGILQNQISAIGFCSVVPAINQIVKNACLKLFNKEPLLLTADVKTGLKINYENANKLGSDRIAAAIGAICLQSERKNLIVVDMGTATTVDAISKNSEFMGGAILPGIKLMVKALSGGTAQLPPIELFEPQNACGNSTQTCIRSGIFYGALGGIRELILRYTKETFHNEKPVVIATGGFSKLFETQNIFNLIEENLVLLGLKKIIDLNK